MIKLFISSFTKPASLSRPTSLTRLLASKVDDAWHSLKWNERVTDRAIALIFGQRKYENLTLEEQQIVDLYQAKKLEEDAVILPNTGADLEQAELEELMLKRYQRFSKVNARHSIDAS